MWDVPGPLKASMKLKDLIQILNDAEINLRDCEEEVGVEVTLHNGYVCEAEIVRVEFSKTVNPNIRLVCE